jgi:hypothetical protein
MILRKIYKLIEKLGPDSKIMLSVTEVGLRIFHLLKLGKEPQQRFVIYMQGRSGSSFFCDLLDQHPLIRCNSEILNKKRYNPIKFLRDLSYYYGEKYPVWGFKFKGYRLGLHNISAEDFLQQLSSKQFKVISLTRYNSLRTALSTWVAYKRGDQYHNTDEIQERKKVTVSIDELIGAIERAEEIRQEMKDNLNKVDALELVYEVDLATPEKAAASCERAFRYLGVDPIEVKSKFRKVSTGRLSDDLENAEAIYEFIKNSKYAHFLEGVSL